MNDSSGVTGGVGVADIALLSLAEGVQYGGGHRRVGRVVQIDHGVPSHSIKSFTTSPAMINPAAAGTKALLPGTCRRCVHLRAVPGGQMQCVLQLMDMSSSGVMGGSLE